MKIKLKKNKLKKIIPLALALSSAFCCCSVANAQSLEERIDQILSKMTTEEKILQLHQEGSFNTQDNTRLNIPGFIMADGPHGVRDGSATAFPVGIAVTATWDKEIAERLGAAMGKEFRGKGKHQALGPAMDLDRDPRNGRSAESGGEDPFLDAQITTSVVKGIQSTPCIATIKHYNTNHRENGRFTNNIIVSQKMLMDFYGLYFRTAVQQGGAFSVMNAYTLVNSQKSAESKNLLTTILREKWGFPYYVVSDWNSIWNSENAIKAGCDICMGSDNYKNDLPGLVKSGAVPISVLDEAVRRVLRTKIVSGMLDYYPSGDPSDVNSKEHQALCLEAARKVMILLKNQSNILPLNKTSVRSIALIGPSAAVAQIDGSGSAYVTPFYSISPKAGLENKIGSSKIFYAKGCDINSTDTSGFAYARQIAASADVVIYCGGLDAAQEGEGFDRVGSTTDLPGRQQDLINSLAKVNKNIVAAIYSGGVCGLNRSIDNIRGLIYAFYPGQEGGNALADVIFGDYNPGGKLPVTMPKSDSQLPAWNDNFTDDYGGGYFWYDQLNYTPQFPFGYGLSYTTFSYSNISLSSSSVQLGQPVNVSVEVTNTGLKQGEEVVQLYLTAPAVSLDSPLKQLRGFKRISLEPGQKQTVTFTLTNDEFYYYKDKDSSFAVAPGTYTVKVGGSSDNLPMTADFQIIDGAKKPDLLITGIRMVPRYPVKGEKVQFLATVKNQGTGATVSGSPVKVSFLVNGKLVNTSVNYSKSIPAGGMALIAADGGGQSETYQWNADSIGTYKIEAKADYTNSVDECVEDNNNLIAEFSVYPKPAANLALKKTVTATSMESTSLSALNAVDGNQSTRWSSEFKDPQYITVDLGSSFKVTQVVLRWENAYGKEYEIQSSLDGVNWTVLKHEYNSDGGIDKIDCSSQARYVRMYGIKRATEWGYSLYEFEVYSADILSDVKTDKDIKPLNKFALNGNYPNPFNPSTSISYEVGELSDVKLEIYNLIGQQVATLVNLQQPAGKYQVQWDGKDNKSTYVPSGVYLCRMQAGKFSQTKKLLLIK